VDKADNSDALIMVVDDEWLNRELMEGILTTFGYKVLLVASGTKALEVAPQKKPALILLDVRLPDLSGYEVCRKLKESDETKAIPVVMTTALEIGDKEKEQTKQCGASDIINRNLPFDVLTGKINALIAPKSDNESETT